MFHIKNGILFFKRVFFFFERICCDLLNSSSFILFVQKSVSQKNCGLSTSLLGISNVALLSLSKVGSSTMEATLSRMEMYSVTCYIQILEISQDLFDLFSCSIIETILQSGVNFSLGAMSREDTMEQIAVDDIYLCQFQLILEQIGIFWK